MCKWEETIHTNHWVCTECFYNHWGYHPPDDCMHEDSKEQMRDFRKVYNYSSIEIIKKDYERNEDE